MLKLVENNYLRTYIFAVAEKSSRRAETSWPIAFVLLFQLFLITLLDGQPNASVLNDSKLVQIKIQSV